ncbi:MAG TPA: 3-oxoacyl-[acyl-carrier-protein] reductase [Vicinamibacterales bacterium]
MQLDLSGRVAIVTGASRGIGRAVALTLARAGAAVVAVARGEQAAAVAAEIVEAGGRALGCTADVTDAAAVEAVVRQAGDTFGRVDILVNNAGITRDGLLLRMKREDWDAVLLTNLTGAFVFTQAAIKVMVRQRYGRIVNISSVVGQSGNAGQANYAASKAGLIGFTKSVAREVASRNITANVVAPGFIDTDMTRVVPEAVQKTWLESIPVGRLGTPEDVADAVCFLASERASYITGHVLAVNGGMYC